jgi:hypothetical protein
MVELSVDGGVIRTTPNHPFYVRGKGFTPAAELESGCQFRGHNGQLVELKQKTITDKIELVFNIHVADNHTYFVGESNRKTSVLVHNQSGGMSQDGTGPDPVTAGNVIGAHGTFPYYPLFGENSPFLPQPTDVRAGGSYDVSKGSGSLNVALGWGNSFLIFVNENNIPNQMQVGGGVQMNLPWLPGFGMSGERRPDGKYEGGLYYIHRH